MIKILISCGAGMSSSFLCQKLQKACEEKGLQDEYAFDFYPINGDNTASSITLSLDVTSSLKLTGDTYVTSLEKRIVPIQTSILMVIHFMLMVLL